MNAPSAPYHHSDILLLNAQIWFWILIRTRNEMKRETQKHWQQQRKKKFKDKSGFLWFFCLITQKSNKMRLSWQKKNEEGKTSATRKHSKHVIYPISGGGGGHIICWFVFFFSIGTWCTHTNINRKHSIGWCALMMMMMMMSKSKKWGVVTKQKKRLNQIRQRNNVY